MLQCAQYQVQRSTSTPCVQASCRCQLRSPSCIHARHACVLWPAGGALHFHSLSLALSSLSPPSSARTQARQPTAPDSFLLASSFFPAFDARGTGARIQLSNVDVSLPPSAYAAYTAALCGAPDWSFSAELTLGHAGIRIGRLEQPGMLLVNVTIAQNAPLTDAALSPPAAGSAAPTPTSAPGAGSGSANAAKPPPCAIAVVTAWDGPYALHNTIGSLLSPASWSPGITAPGSQPARPSAIHVSLDAGPGEVVRWQPQPVDDERLEDDAGAKLGTTAPAASGEAAALACYGLQLGADVVLRMYGRPAADALAATTAGDDTDVSTLPAGSSNTNSSAQASIDAGTAAGLTHMPILDLRGQAGLACINTFVGGCRLQVGSSGAVRVLLRDVVLLNLPYAPLATDFAGLSMALGSWLAGRR